MGPEELDELLPLRSRAPRTEPVRRLERSTTPPARGHRRTLFPSVCFRNRDGSVAVDADLDREDLVLDPFLPAQEWLGVARHREHDAVSDLEALLLAHDVHQPDEVENACLEDEVVVQGRVESDGDAVRG